MSVFVDTSAWYALLDKKDPKHLLAVKTYQGLQEERETLVTNNSVLTETIALIANRVGSKEAQNFCQEMASNPIVEIHCLNQEQFLETCRRYSTSSRGVSLVDCSAFVTMEAQKIRRAFAYDEDFARAGFTVL